MESSDTNATSTNELKPRDILCVYAQEDERFYLRLQKSLNLWKRQGQVHWLALVAGNERVVTMRDYVQHADLILLLLSPDFFSDDLCYQTMHLSLQEHASRQVPVVPLLVRAVLWQQEGLQDLAIMPRNEQPVASWTSPDEAFVSIGADLARLLPTWRLLIPTRPVLFRVPDLPEGYVPRSEALQEIKSMLLEQRSGQTMAITTALRGAGGFGKTTLACALCHDPDIQAAFPDILWVELGERPPSSLDLLNRLLTFLGGSHTEAITLQEAQERWYIALRDRVCLLVIDDVWQEEALSPLLKGGAQCIRLVTTRNDLLLPKDAARILVDAMNQLEAVMLLCQDKDVRDEISEARYQPKLEALVTRLGFWPLLLTLARGILTDLVVEYHLSIDDALTTIAEMYQTRGVTAFRLDNIDERQRTVDACLRVSVQHLEMFTHPSYHAAERYQELAVFPEDTDIPLATLQMYWKESAGLEPWETRDLCIRLHRLSLLLTCDLEKGTIRLHDVIRSYLSQQIGFRLSELHTHFLDALRQVLGIQQWADVPASEQYLWQHLIWHLCQRNHQEGLVATLTDLWYLIRKVLYVGVASLEADLLLAQTYKKMGVDEIALLTWVSQKIIRISHLLYQTKTEAALGGLLWSHLGGHSVFAAQRSLLEQALPRPFLVAWHVLLDGSSSALQRTLSGHTGIVWNCAVSGDGRTIVSASQDGTLKVWDAASGAERLTLRERMGMVNACAFSPDGKWIVSAFDGDTLKVWDTATGEERLILSGHTDIVWNCAVSGDGRTIVSASWDGTLKVWDATTGEERLTLSLSISRDKISSCAVSGDGRTIVSSSGDRTLKVWDATTGEERLTLTGHTDSVRSCAVSPDGRFIVSSGDRTLKVWDATTGEERLILSGHTDIVWNCAVSGDGRTIVSASQDGTLKVWDATTGEERLTLFGHTKSVKGCAVSRDGHVIVSASEDGTLKVWNAATRAERRISLSGHSHGVFGCAVSGDGCMIVSASWDETLKVWNAATGEVHLTLSGHTSGVHGCAVSPNGLFIVSASWDGTLKVWDAATGEERLTLSGHTDRVNSCAVSGDGCAIVSASQDSTLKVWDAATGEERLTLSGHTGWIHSCAVSGNGRTIVSASEDRTLKVWDAATGEERLTLSGHTDAVNGCAVSPNGLFIVSASSDRTIKVWDLQVRQCVLTFPVDGPLSGCAFHPDGEHLVACGDQGVYFLRLVM